MVRQLGSTILDTLYPPRVTRERYRAVIARLNGRLRDLRADVSRLEAALAMAQGSGTRRPAGAAAPANDNASPRRNVPMIDRA